MARIRERPSYEGIPSDRMECLGSKLESYGLDATLELLQAEKENDTAVPRLVASEKVSNYQSDRNVSSHLPSGFPETSLSLCESCQDIRSNHNQSIPTAVPEAETATTLSSLTVVSGSQSAVGPQRAKTLSDARPASSRAVLVASPIRQSMDKIEYLKQRLFALKKQADENKHRMELNCLRSRPASPDVSKNERHNLPSDLPPLARQVSDEFKTPEEFGCRRGERAESDRPTVDHLLRGAIPDVFAEELFFTPKGVSDKPERRRLNSIHLPRQLPEATVLMGVRPKPVESKPKSPVKIPRLRLDRITRSRPLMTESIEEVARQVQQSTLDLEIKPRSPTRQPRRPSKAPASFQLSIKPRRVIRSGAAPPPIKAAPKLTPRTLERIDRRMSHARDASIDRHARAREKPLEKVPSLKSAPLTPRRLASVEKRQREANEKYMQRSSSRSRVRDAPRSRSQSVTRRIDEHLPKSYVAPQNRPIGRHGDPVGLIDRHPTSKPAVCTLPEKPAARPLRRRSRSVRPLTVPEEFTLHTNMRCRVKRSQ
ncbi:MAG: uncharacterized protein KVP18_002737 [Porospora cf. gigantea A]|nr:MAG: hypothetical protein KVP18_002737 [Porospora cf. gigantea A]